jgi:hypothetical protein
MTQYVRFSSGQDDYGRPQLSYRATYRIARRALRSHRGCGIVLWSGSSQRLVKRALADRGAGGWPLPLGYPDAAVNAAMAVEEERRMSSDMYLVDRCGGVLL